MNISCFSSAGKTWRQSPDQDCEWKAFLLRPSLLPCLPALWSRYVLSDSLVKRDPPLLSVPNGRFLSRKVQATRTQELFLEDLQSRDYPCHRSVPNVPLLPWSESLRIRVEGAICPFSGGLSGDSEKGSFLEGSRQAARWRTVPTLWPPTRWSGSPFPPTRCSSYATAATAAAAV